MWWPIDPCLRVAQYLRQQHKSAAMFLWGLPVVLQYRVEKFKAWKPLVPRVVSTSRSHVELSWSQESEPFGFLGELLLYRIQKKEKIPPWVIVYWGGKTSKVIDNLPPSQPHKFRLLVILRDGGVPLLASRAVDHYGSEGAVYHAFGGDSGAGGIVRVEGCSKRWLESRWSDETWSSTASAGASAACFCMAVRCGYLAQVQSMLEERPELVDVVNSTTGLTPLATAVVRGDAAMVRALLSAGADAEGTVGGGRTALQLAVLHAPDLAAVLLDRGASLESRDVNGLRAEHYVADGGRAGVLGGLAGADPGCTDHNGWTPLFRAVVQGASSELISELSAATPTAAERDLRRDRAGLTLRDAALMLRDQRGGRRQSVLHIVDPQYGRARDNYARVRQKVTRLQSLVPRGERGLRDYHDDAPPG